MSAPSPSRFWTRVLASLVPARERDHLIYELSTLYLIRRARWGQDAADGWYRREVLGFLITRLLTLGFQRSPSPFTRPPRGSIMSDLFRDLTRAARSLARRPAFTMVAVLTIALGIGGSTAVFGLANWLLLRPVPGVPDTDRLGIALFAEELGNGGYSPRGISYPNYYDLIEGIPAAQHLVGYQPASVHIGVDGAEPRSVSAEFVMWDYFDALGVRALDGRTFRRSDERSDRELSGVILSERLWRSLLMQKHVDPDLTVHINGLEANVLGVVPSPFHGLERLGDTDVWLPGASYAYVHRWEARLLGARDRTIFYWFLVQATPEVTFEQIQTQLRGGIDGLRAAYPDMNESFETTTVTVTAGIGANPRSVVVSHRMLSLLSGTVGLVLVLACANMANLLVLRGVQRRGDTAVRRALGEPFHRLVRYDLLESLLLALAGAAAAIPITMLLFRLFDGTTLGGVGTIEGIAIDWRLVAFAATLAVLTSLVFGSAPGVLSARTDVAATMQSVRRSQTVRHGWIRESLTVMQLALAATVVVGAFLLIGTMRQLVSIELGFNPEGVTSFYVRPGDHGYDQAELSSYHQRLEERLAQIPSVTGVASTTHLPLWSRHLYELIDPANPTDTVVSAVAAVGQRFFEATQISLVAGRVFHDNEIFEQETPIPVVVSDSLAQRLFAGRNPLGRPFVSREYRAPPREYVVIGVAANTRWDDLEESSGPLLFLPYHASPYQGTSSYYVVRSSLATTQLTPLLREAAASIDATLPLSSVRPLQDVVEGQIAQRRLLMRTLTVLAIFAVFLATAGLYSVVAFGVAERTRDFGIRVALGANDGRVLGLVLREAGVLAGIGVVLGLAGAAGFSRWLESRLFGIDPLEPSIYLGAALGLGFVALLAGLGPARRATRVDPMVALRCE